jgi:hypothetical protein
MTTAPGWDNPRGAKATGAKRSSSSSRCARVSHSAPPARTRWRMCGCSRRSTGRIWRGRGCRSTQEGCRMELKWGPGANGRVGFKSWAILLQKRRRACRSAGTARLARMRTPGAGLHPAGTGAQRRRGRTPASCDGRLLACCPDPQSHPGQHGREGNLWSGPRTA